jgi:hypothetical protein
MVNAAAISHNVTLSKRAAMAATAVSTKSRMLNAGRTSQGSNTPIIRNAGIAIRTLNSASMPSGSGEGGFLIVQSLFEATMLFPSQLALGNKDRRRDNLIEMPTEVGQLYQKVLVRGKGCIVSEPVACRRRTS